MALTNPCKAREPKVIDNELIRECINQQLPKGELGRLMKAQGSPVDQILEMRFEFMNILKIDHVWVLKSLVKLKLNNNYIEKIENLESLVNLEELDLSFNKISKIENLDTLTKLRKLNLYENFIEKLENLTSLKSLSIFSIGKNNISAREEIHCLRRLPHLVSLNMSQNPCHEAEDFRMYVAALIPHLVYYEYRRIQDDERYKGTMYFKQQILDVEAQEERDLAKVLQKEKEDQEAELNMSSFVEYLNTRNLFEKMYEKDDDGKLLLLIGEDVTELYAEYETNFLNACKDLFEIGQKHYKIRCDEIDAFMYSTQSAKKDNQLESIKYMEEFVEAKNEQFIEVKQLQQQLDDALLDDDEYSQKLSELTQKYSDLIHTTWKKLMKLELYLFEALDEVNQSFEHVLTEMVNTFIEEAQNIFTIIRSLEKTYTENITEAANKLAASIGVVEDLVVSDILKPIILDKDALMNCLGGTHDVHMVTIDDREDTLIFRAKNWLDTFLKNLYDGEVQRNRYKVLEVSHFLDIQRDEFEELITPVAPPPDPDAFD